MFKTVLMLAALISNDLGSVALATVFAALMVPFTFPAVLSALFLFGRLKMYPRGWALHIVVVACALPYVVPYRAIPGPYVVYALISLLAAAIMSFVALSLLVARAEPREISRQERFLRSALGLVPYVLFLTSYTYFYASSSPPWLK